MADQHFDRADMCPSAVAEPLGYTFFPPGIVALKYRTCLLADLTLVKAYQGGGRMRLSCLASGYRWLETRLALSPLRRK